MMCGNVLVGTQLVEHKEEEMHKFMFAQEKEFEEETVVLQHKPPHRMLINTEVEEAIYRAEKVMDVVLKDEEVAVVEPEPPDNGSISKQWGPWC